MLSKVYVIQLWTGTNNSSLHSAQGESAQGLVVRAAFVERVQVLDNLASTSPVQAVKCTHREKRTYRLEMTETAEAVDRHTHMLTEVQSVQMAVY